MQIVTRYIKAFRFLSFNQLSLDESDLVHRGNVHGIRGRSFDRITDNGIGKTTIPRVKYYGFYGQDLFKTTLENLSNDIVNGGHCVIIGFTVGEKKYEIQRYHNFIPFEGGPVMEGSEKKSAFKGLRFYELKGDTKVSIIGEDDAETQEMINSILGVSPEMAKIIFFVPQNQGSPLLTSAPGKTQELFMEFFPLEFLDKSLESVDEILSQTKDKKAQITVSKEKLMTEAESKKSTLDSMFEKKAEFEAKREERLKEARAKFLAKKSIVDKLKEALPQEGQLELFKNESEEVSTLIRLNGESAEEKALESKINESQKLEDEDSSLLSSSSQTKAKKQELLFKAKAELATLDLPKLSQEEEVLKEKISKGAEASKAIQERILTINSQLSDLSVKKSDANSALKALDSKKTLLATLKGNLASLQEARVTRVASEIESELEVLRGVFSDYKSVIAGSDKKTLLLKMKESAEKREAIRQEIEQKSQLVKNLSGSNEELVKAIAEKNNELMALNVQREHLRISIADLKSKLESYSENCPTCHRAWDKDHEHYQDKGSIEKNLNDKESGLLDKENAITALNSEISSLNNDLALFKVKDDISLLSERVSILEQDLEFNQKWIGKVEEAEKGMSECEVKGKALKEELVAAKSVQEREKILAEISLLETEVSREQDLKKEVEQSESKYTELYAEKIKLADQDDVESNKMRLADVVRKKEKADLLFKEAFALEGEMDSINNEIARLSEEVRKHKESRETLRRAIDQVREESKKKSEDLQKRYQELSKKIGDFEKAIEIHAIEDADLNKIKEEGTSIKSEANPMEALIAQTKGAIEDLEVRAEELSSKIRGCEEDLFIYQSIKEMFGPKGIKSYVVDNIIDDLNEKVARNIGRFNFGDQIGVRFEPVSVTQKGVIKSEINKIFTLRGKEKEYGNFSGGQMGIIMFSVNQAIREIAENRSRNKFDQLYFDEPFNGMCHNGQAVAMNMLAELSKDRNGIFIVSHDVGLQQLCPDSIYIVMKNDVSYKVSRKIFDGEEKFSPTDIVSEVKKSSQRRAKKDKEAA